MLAATILSIYAHMLDTPADEKPNPILDPIFNFFKSIWSGLGTMWTAFCSAISSWFHKTVSVTYWHIPVGPLIIIGIGIVGFFMLWGFIKLKELFSDE